MAFNINDFRGQMTGGGARSTLFEVVLTLPPVAMNMDTEKFSFMCKATSLPGSTVGTMEIPYFGRVTKFPGDRTFEDWQVTVINDESFDIRNGFEQWSKAIASYNTENQSIRSSGATSNPNSYVANAIVNQYGKEGEIIKQVTIVNIWPTMISPIELNWENNNQVEQFDVTFAYDYFQSDSTV